MAHLKNDARVVGSKLLEQEKRRTGEQYEVSIVSPATMNRTAQKYVCYYSTNDPCCQTRW
jgi:hypothetical protein